MRVRIDKRAVARWRGDVFQKGGKIRPVAAATLNYAGDKYVDELVGMLADQSGLSPESIRRRLQVKRATQSSLNFQVEGSAALLDDLSRRPMRGRSKRFKQRDDSFFAEGELVNIANMGDDRVCDICDEAADQGPYTIEEARAMIPLHPNCRCVVEPTEGRRRAPRDELRRGGSFRGGQRFEAMQDLLNNMRVEVAKVVRG